MKKYILSFEEINGSSLPEVGGKGANLGELSKIEGIQVPKGICVTTEVYKRIIEGNKELNIVLDQLSTLKERDKEKITHVSSELRRIVERIEVPKDVEEAIRLSVTKLGEDNFYAIRSSATAEDLPLASFAGQHDTYLNIRGIDSILEHIRKCWASLFTDRAIIYRIKKGFEHRKVYISVILQQMIFPQASGIMFTADPITGSRKVLSIDASFGLGEALVSGLVNSDNYKVREKSIINKTIASKKLEIYSLQNGGTKEREVDENKQNMQTLTDQQILELSDIGMRIEKYFGSPQDIEWCLYDSKFYIVQSRPITTLYPIPENDGKLRVYGSMGHVQMMTEDIKPLGISFCRMLSFWFGENLVEAGGRLFMDGTHDLASPIRRKSMISSLGKTDILMKNALSKLIERKDFINALPRGKSYISAGPSVFFSWIIPALKIYKTNDKALIEELISHNEGLVSELEKSISCLSGDELMRFIQKDTKELKSKLLDSKNMSMLAIATLVPGWINNKMQKWLGEKNAADVLSKSVKNNVTSDMVLELLDVAVVVRQYPEVIEYFKNANDDTFFEDLEKLRGGDAVSNAIREYLKKYGMRCPGEIDITKPRWSEKPTALIPMILNNMKSFAGSSSEILEQGHLEAEKKEKEILIRLEQLSGGKRKAKKARKMISLLRNFIGFREYPKYSFIKRFATYKNALMKEAEILVHEGVIKVKEDIYYLYFEELHEAIRTKQLDYSIIIKRKEEYEIYEKLTPPRVMTSEGEIVSGEYSTGNIPKGALKGVPISSGVIEGRARVVLRLEDAMIEDGDILVTTFTDPSWTSLFVSVKGLVTEVGGLTTHGSVIAREYGIPGVVGVENATNLIQDGQRIRINGNEGYIEIL